MSQDVQNIESHQVHIEQGILPGIRVVIELPEVTTSHNGQGSTIQKDRSIAALTLQNAVLII
jgi:hypothetical protein